MSTLWILKSNLKWVASALMNDRSRPVMSLAHVTHKDGCAWLISSDTHSLHALKLGADTEIPEMSFDLRQLLADMTWHGVTAVEWKDGQWVFNRKNAGKSDKPLAVYKPDRFIREFGGTVPDWQRVVPTEPEPITSDFAINWKFFQRACNRQGYQRTVLRMDTPNKPLLITPHPMCPWKCEWFAVIMPMALGYGE